MKKYLSLIAVIILSTTGFCQGLPPVIQPDPPCGGVAHQGPEPYNGMYIDYTCPGTMDQACANACNETFFLAVQAINQLATNSFFDRLAAYNACIQAACDIMLSAKHANDATLTAAYNTAYNNYMACLAAGGSSQACTDAYINELNAADAAYKAAKDQYMAAWRAAKAACETTYETSEDLSTNTYDQMYAAAKNATLYCLSTCCEWWNARQTKANFHSEEVIELIAQENKPIFTGGIL